MGDCFSFPNAWADYFYFFSFVVSMATLFFVVKFRKIVKEKGPLKGLCNFRFAMYIFWLDFNHHSNQKATLMMDGLDPSSPKSDGHDYLVATLLAKGKTCLHLIQALKCPLPLLLQWVKVSSPLEVTMEHEI